MIGPIASPAKFIYDFSSFPARQRFSGERVRTPGWIQWLAERGAPVPEYGPKRHAFEDRDVPGYSARRHGLFSTFPPFQHGATAPPRLRALVAEHARASSPG